MRHLLGFLLYLSGWARVLLGILAAMLPARWWPWLDRHIPATDSAPIAAIVTILTAGAIGVPGFISHVTDQVAENNRAILEAARREASRPASQETVSANDWGRMFVNASGLSLFTFILLTPAGWASTYLGVSGMWRAIAVIVDHPFGDPILTGLDALVLRSTRERRARVARRRRESLEGPEVPDRIVPGAKLGLPGVDLVIVASRVKSGWDKGTVVLSADKTYRVGPIEERTIAGRLRTLYPLTEHKDLEVFRRTVRYDLPD